MLLLAALQLLHILNQKMNTIHLCRIKEVDTQIPSLFHAVYGQLFCLLSVRIHPIAIRNHRYLETSGAKISVLHIWFFAVLAIHNILYLFQILYNLDVNANVKSYSHSYSYSYSYSIISIHSIIRLIASDYTPNSTVFVVLVFLCNLGKGMVKILTDHLWFFYYYFLSYFLL